MSSRTEMFEKCPEKGHKYRKLLDGVIWTKYRFDCRISLTGSYVLIVAFCISCDQKSRSKAPAYGF